MLPFTARGLGKDVADEFVVDVGEPVFAALIDVAAVTRGAGSRSRRAVAPLLLCGTVALHAMATEHRHHVAGHVGGPER